MKHLDGNLHVRERQDRWSRICLLASSFDEMKSFWWFASAWEMHVLTRSRRWDPAAHSIIQSISHSRPSDRCWIPGVIIIQIHKIYKYILINDRSDGIKSPLRATTDRLPLMTDTYLFNQLSDASSWCEKLSKEITKR